MEPSRIHELNKIAGEFCELEILERIRDDGMFFVLGLEDRRKITSLSWDPCSNHNHADVVKAKLREKFIRYSMRMIFLCSGQIFHEWELEDLDGFAHNGRDESELIALLLAVEALGKEVA